jgi:hypothetical protein
MVTELMGPRGMNGPALLIFNDAVFSADDWAAITCIGMGHKASDKIGKYGVGFNAVYHLTDLPCILSGAALGMLDPLRSCVNPPHGGRQCVVNRVAAACPDQLPPFCVQDFVPQGGADALQTESGFPGTVLRLPLRAKESDIAAVCPAQKAEAQLQVLRRELGHAALFLRSIQSVTITVRDAKGAVTWEEVVTLKRTPKVRLCQNCLSVQCLFVCLLVCLLRLLLSFRLLGVFRLPLSIRLSRATEQLATTALAHIRPLSHRRQQTFQRSLSPSASSSPPDGSCRRARQLRPPTTQPCSARWPLSCLRTRTKPRTETAGAPLTLAAPSAT